MGCRPTWTYVGIKQNQVTSVVRAAWVQHHHPSRDTRMHQPGDVMRHAERHERAHVARYFSGALDSYRREHYSRLLDASLRDLRKTLQTGVPTETSIDMMFELLGHVGSDDAQESVTRYPINNHKKFSNKGDAEDYFLEWHCRFQIQHENAVRRRILFGRREVNTLSDCPNTEGLVLEVGSDSDHEIQTESEEPAESSSTKGKTVEAPIDPEGYDM